MLRTGETKCSEHSFIFYSLLPFLFQRTHREFPSALLPVLLMQART